MYRARHGERRTRRPAAAGPSDELRLAITFPGRSEGQRPTKLGFATTGGSVARFVPDPLHVDRALHLLARRGFRIATRGHLTATARVERHRYEAAFGTTLEPLQLDARQPYQFHSLFYPRAGAPWQPAQDVATLIDDAYIQWPAQYLAPPGNGPVSANAPQTGGGRIRLPDDLVRLLRADAVHQAGVTGRGIRVAMIDSGFAHDHPFFASRPFNATNVLAPGATGRGRDPHGHGTGQSANLLSIAPGVSFVGVKIENDEQPDRGASILEALHEAMRHQPRIISISLCHDLCDTDTRVPFSTLPNGLTALAIEIQSIVAQGVTVVCAAGNGQYGFPGMMPETISAGGVFAGGRNLQASDYASAFPSAIYAGRAVPDVCGLVGMQPSADYIMMPVPAGSDVDRETAGQDGTAEEDGWAAFSGTSSAAPQIAGVCALLLEANPGLTPAEVKSLLQRTARDVAVGHANDLSDPAGLGLPASSGTDGATGAGLVSALAAFQQAR